MLTPQNKIIIVDDNPEHLKYLAEEFHNNGIGCRTFEYNIDYNIPLEGVRIAFFDINIIPSGGGSDSQKFNALVNAIKQYISPNNGPFVLVFWTANKDDIDKLKAYIQERHSNCPRPFVTSHIDKNEVLDGGAPLWEKLKVVLGDPAIDLLYDFEKKASQAAVKTINQIYAIIPQEDSWGDNVTFKANMEKIFSKVAASTLGMTHAKSNADKAVYEALIPTLNHHVNIGNIDKKWEVYLKTLAAKEKIKEIILPNNFKEGKLNSVLHIETNIVNPDVRGIVVELDKSDKAMKENFNDTFPNWIKKIIHFKQNQSAEITAQIDLLISNAQLIAIEISSACDFSQNNDRLHKYLVGVKIGNISGLIGGSAGINSFNLDGQTFSLGDEDFQLCLNLNYCFGTIPKSAIVSKPLFILKKEIVDMIGNRYANHISRIGITSF